MSGPSAPDEEPAGGERAVAGLIFGDEFDEVRVEGDVAVVVEFPDRDPQPGFVADDGDGVGFEVAEFTDAHPGPGQQLDREPAEQVRFVGEGSHELGVVAVVEELRE